MVRVPPHIALWWVAGGATIFLTLVLNVPFRRGLFQFAPLDPIDLLTCLVAGILGIAWFELLKIFNGHRMDKRNRLTGTELGLE